MGGVSIENEGVDEGENNEEEDEEEEGDVDKESRLSVPPSFSLAFSLTGIMQIIRLQSFATSAVRYSWRSIAQSPFSNSLTQITLSVYILSLISGGKSGLICILFSSFRSV